MRGLEKGAVLSLEKCWELGVEWYRGRHLRAWRARTPEETQALFERLELTGPFWDLGG